MSELLDDQGINAYQSKIGMTSIAALTLLAGAYLIREKIKQSRELYLTPEEIEYELSTTLEESVTSPRVPMISVTCAKEPPVSETEVPSLTGSDTEPTCPPMVITSEIHSPGKKSNYIRDNRPDEPYNLTQSENNYRRNIIAAAKPSAAVGDVHYKLSLLVQPGQKFYGHAEIVFKLAKYPNPNAPLWLDLSTTKIFKVFINGQQENVHFENSKLQVVGLKRGENTIEISYETDFSKNGNGLHRFVDPEDKEEYFATFFEPFAAHKVFPCFDQPNIKGVYTLTVCAPSSWSVISNEAASSVEAIDDAPSAAVFGFRDHSQSYNLHSFPVTPRMSTYLFGFAAGPYTEYRLDSSASPPIGLYCRKSQARYLQSVRDTIFDWTRKGLKFYEGFYGVAYPFSKYDYVFAPEFPEAEENPGCVFVSDSWIPKVSEPSKTSMFYFCSLLMHEMCHMWFGDLVTPQWWNDLWLKESMAEYFSYLCLQSMDEFPDTWCYYLTELCRGYDLDMTTNVTHPVSSEIENTSMASTNFDTISYQKGMGIIRQFVFTVGEEAFQVGVQKYFDRYAWGNANLNNFISCFEIEGLNLFEWAESWLNTAGLNELRITYVSNALNKLQDFKVEQKAVMQEHPTLRQHTVNIDFFHHTGKLNKRIPLKIPANNITTLNQFKNNVRPVCAILNADSQGYCKTIIDQASMKFITENVKLLSTSLAAITRQQIWKVMYEQVTDLKKSVYEFLDYAVLAFPEETNEAVIVFIAGRVAEALQYYTPAGDKRDEIYSKMFAISLDRISGARRRADAHLYKDILLKFLHTEADIQTCTNWVKSGSTGITMLDLDEHLTWEIIKKYATTTDATELMESRKSGSHVSHLAEIYCQYANPAKKDENFKYLYMFGDQYSHYEARAAILGWRDAADNQILENFASSYFENIQSVIDRMPECYAQLFLKMMVPTYCEEDFVLQSILMAIPKIPECFPGVVKELKIAMNKIETRRAIKEFALSENN